MEFSKMSRRPSTTHKSRPARPTMEPLDARLFLHGTPEEVGTGLLATYFDNKDFTNPKLTRTDAQVNFAWSTGSPAPTAGIAADTFSVRWTGQLVPHTTES